MNEQNIPTHVGFILDGNGRWAKKQGKVRVKGHVAGKEAILNIIEECGNLGIKYVSVYAFSTENFTRPLHEVDFIMKLFDTAFKKDIHRVAENNVKVVFSGIKDNLAPSLVKSMDKVTENSKNNTGLVLNICFHYGSQMEIIDMVKKIHQDLNKKELKLKDLTPEIINKYMYNDLPPLDLIIRTSGEQRLSNFMLWQAAYAELYFTNTYWPDFNKEELNIAIKAYQDRNRRFGGVDDD